MDDDMKESSRTLRATSQVTQGVGAMMEKPVRRNPRDMFKKSKNHNFSSKGGFN